MRLAPFVLFVFLSPLMALGKANRNDDHSSGQLLRIVIEALPGLIFYPEANGTKTQPALAVEIGVGMPLSRLFLMQVLAGYEFASSTQFDGLRHGPGGGVFIMAEPLHRFAVGLGARGGLDFKRSSFEGGRLSLDAKIMIGFISAFELGLQGGPRVAIHKDKTYWGGEIFAVAGLIL